MCAALARFVVDPDPAPARRLLVGALLRRLCCGGAKPIDFFFSNN
jgi:hypothetical protein